MLQVANVGAILCAIMENNKKPQARMPQVTLRLTNPITFNVEVDYECPSLYIARAMLQEGLHAIARQINDMEAIEFQKRMEGAQQAWAAMQKNPGHA